MNAVSTAAVGVVLLGPGVPPEGIASALAEATGEAIQSLDGSWGWAVRSTVRDRDAESLARQLGERFDCDAAVVPAALVAAPPALVVTDVDSTLTTTEAIDLLAARAGSGEAVAAVTERAMRGELDFAASLRERVATLAGQPESIIDEVLPQVTLSEGARNLVEAVHAWGGRVAVVSGGFVPLVAPLADQLDLDDFAANELTIADGQLTGEVTGRIVDREFKAEQLARWAEVWGVPADQTVAVGDGANDLDLLASAGLGIAYCAKPVTAEQADAAISFPRLDAVLALISPWELPSQQTELWSISDHGAQVMAWQPTDDPHPVIWHAPEDLWEEPPGADGGVLRGGVPVCFPWFGQGGRPVHGTARRQVWQRTAESEHDGTLRVTHSLTLDGWQVEQHTTMAADQLELRLWFTNTSDAPQRVEAAHHTYLRVGDVEQVTLEGLAGKRYWDAVQDLVTTFPDQPLPVAPHTDFVVETTDEVRVVDRAWGRTLVVEREGSPQVVVWNPRPGVAGLGVTNDRWRDFVCVETCMAREHALELAPGAGHEVVTRIRVLPATVS